MQYLNPCKCGGLPYVTIYYRDDDIHKEDPWPIVRCHKCSNVSLEFKENEAISNWNNNNNSFKINNKYLEDKYMLYLHKKQVQKDLGIEHSEAYLLGVEQWEDH